MDTAKLDLGNDGADWIRGRTWDLYARNDAGDLELITTVPAFVDAVAAMGLSVSGFMTLPAARAMPAELHDALEAEGLLG